MSRRHRSVAISDITVGRGRRPRGDVTDLASSIEEVGLLNPVTLTEDLRLVAGLHRLEAAKQLGWSKISAVVLELSKLEAQLAELDENLQRRELTVLERGEQLAKRKQLYEALHPEARKGAAGGHAKASSANEIISFARATGQASRISPRTVQHEVQIASNIPAATRKLLKGTSVEDRKVDLLRIARLPHREQTEVAELLSTGEVSSLGSALSVIAATKAEGTANPLPQGKFSVVAVDPPWPGIGARAEFSMSLDDIRSIDVSALATETATVLLWVPRHMLKLGVDVLEHWGCQQRDALTWIRAEANSVGSKARHADFCIMGTRGEHTTEIRSNVIVAPERRAGQRPDEFYDWVDRHFPGRKVELFGTAVRKGWQSWGSDRITLSQRGRLEPFFSYFGGKWRTARYYPAPLHDTIIEPFAGAAGYATTYAERKVILFEQDPKIFQLWEYLIKTSPEEIMALPSTVEHVDDVKGPDPAKFLVGFWLNKGVTSPRKSASLWARGGTRPNSYWGDAIKKRIAHQVSLIKHWTIKNTSYETAKNLKATWFVDPPYQGVCGAAYRHNYVDYQSLGDWCRSRRGQVIVCERVGAEWLPFKQLGNFKGRGKERSQEAIWTSSV